MNLPPKQLDGAEVICYAILDGDVRHTGSTRQIVHGILQGSMAGLAICSYLPSANEYYLFGCNANWQVVNDTWHATVEDAKAQAEFEYEGVTELWQDGQDL